MKASIITIGDEILIGQIVDTNSVSIAKHLNSAGIVVREKISIGDDRSQIVETVTRSMENAQVTVITGGLGPTKDDITKKTLAELFHSEMRYDETVAAHVEKMLTARGIEFNDLNRSQALVPACCTVLSNAYGTAPGMWFERDGHVVVSLPGVPYEMEHLMQDEVMPADYEHLETVASETRRLSRLVQQMLDLSRLENRTAPMNIEAQLQALDEGRIERFSNVEAPSAIIARNVGISAPWFKQWALNPSKPIRITCFGRSFSTSVFVWAD